MAAAAVDNFLDEQKSFPHLAEGSLKTVHSNYVPTQLEKHLQFIDFNANGDFVVGSSSLHTRYWTGSLWYYKAGTEPSNVTNPENCVTGVDMETGVMDARFVKEDSVVVGLDSGGVAMMTLTRDQDGDNVTSYLEQGVGAMEHDDMLTGMDTWSRGGALATCGLDNRLCVYSPSLALLHSYTPVHTGHVTSVSCDQTRDNVLATCSRDGDTCVRLWDTRASKPASTVMTDAKNPPSCVQWLRDNILIVGDMTGNVSVLDIRSRDSVTRVSVGDRPVFRLRSRGDLVAVCLNDAVVSVLKLTSDTTMDTVLSETKHTDFVRGLAWRDDHCLWSVGWDKTVQTYKV